MGMMFRKLKYAGIRPPQGKKTRWYQDTVTVFAIGVLIGVGLAVTVHHFQDASKYQTSLWQYYLSPVGSNSNGRNLIKSYLDGVYDFKYENWLSKVYGAFGQPQDPDKYRYSDVGGIEAKPRYSNSSGFIVTSQAHFLYDKVPVVCIVFNPETSKGVAAVVNTWGKHCNEIRFYLTTRGQSTEKVVFNQTEANIDNPQLLRKVRVLELATNSEFALMCRSFRQVFKLHRKRVKAGLEHAPWLLIAPENSFVLTENLRFYVAPMNTSQPHYLGHAMKFWGSVYNWQQAGYTLSWKTLEALVKKFPTDSECEKGGKFWKNGDWYLGKHLSSLGIKPIDTRDHIGRGRFNGYSMRKFLVPGGVSAFERYWRDSYYGTSPDGPQCCSNFAITFAGVLSKSKMFQQDYFHHRLRPFSKGGNTGNQPAPINSINKHPSLTLNELMKEEKLMHLFDPFLTTPKSWNAQDRP